MSTTIIRETGESVTFDATLRESHRIEARVTDHPVEDGSVISDHVQTRPRSFSLTLLVSETPINTPGFRVSGVNSSTLGGPSLIDVPNRVKEIFDFLQSIANAGEFVDVVTPKFGTIDDCVIVNIPADIDNINAGRFTIGFRKVKIAERITVQIPPLRPSGEAQTGAPDEQDIGVQPTEDPESIDEAEDASILYGLAETFGFI